MVTIPPKKDYCQILFYRNQINKKQLPAVCAYYKNFKFTETITTAECYLGYPIILIFKLGLASTNCNYSLYKIPQCLNKTNA